MRQKEHRYGQYGGERNTRDYQAGAAKGLDQRGHDDAKSNAANRLSGEPDCVFPSCSGQTLPEAHEAQRRKLAVGIDGRSENDG